MTATDRAIDAVESALESAREKKDADRIVHLELKRDRPQAKAFRALQRRLRKGAG